MMKRRTFLKITGIALAGQALGAASVAGSSALGTTPTASAAAITPRLSTMRLNITEPGQYRVSGLVRLEAPTVEIAGITNAQQISWSGGQSAVSPLARFSSFETYLHPGAQPVVQVLGGQIESLSVVPMEMDEA